MYSAVKTWKTGDLTLDRLRDLSARLGLPLTIIEREIVFYDTLQMIAKCSPVGLVLKGGSLVSRLYSKHPRFSWDIDFSTSLREKDDFPLSRLDRRISSDGGRWSIRLDGTRVDLGKLERDAEKDVFRDILSFRRSMATYTLGASLPVYLRTLGVGLRSLTGGLLRLKDRLGKLPMVDYVRGTVYVKETREVLASPLRSVPSLIGQVLKPLRQARIRCMRPEYCLVDKVSRLASVEGVSLRDQMCDLYDMGQILAHGVDGRLVRERYRQLYAERRIGYSETVRDRVTARARELSGRENLFKSRREFVLVADKYRWKDYCRRTERELTPLLE